MSTLLAQGFDIGQKLFLDENGTRNVAITYPTIATFLNLLVPLSFLIAGIVLLVLLIGGGFSMIASGGSAKEVEQGKTKVTGAVIGFLLMFSAFWIIQIIEKVTGVPILNSSL